MRVSGRRVLLGVTGSIAAYKGAELARKLTERGFQVTVVLTEAGARFVSAVTFEALTGRRAYTDMFAGGEMLHIRLERDSDLLLIAPATADFIAKMALGLGDDLLSTILLSRTHPVVVAPAMNAEMYRNPTVRRNIGSLELEGFVVLPTGVGGLACGETGPGRMLEPDQIVQAVIRTLSEKDFQGTQVVVTAGPTREPLDDVRFFSNPSTGRMGCAIAEAAERRGARTILVTGPATLAPPEGVITRRVTTGREMLRAVVAEARRADFIYMAAAVSDYAPAKPVRGKPPKEALGDAFSVRMVRNPDILGAVSGVGKRGQVRIGFAAEWGKPDPARIRRKLVQKAIGGLFVNDVSRSETGFGAEANEGWWLETGADPLAIPRMSKEDLADALLDFGLRLRSAEKPATRQPRKKRP
jgi:phosphopantothenoylcysteine decarboxylase/phosphopantothenate--cysteine ligase